VKPNLLVLTIIQDGPTRSFAKMLLEGTGHRVIESSDFQRAESLLRNGLDPDLVIVESLSTGPIEAAQCVRVLRCAPRHRTCLILGSAEDGLRKQALDLGIKHLLNKQTHLVNLGAVINEMTNPPLLGTDTAPVADLEDTFSAASHVEETPGMLYMEELGDDQFFLAASPKMLQIHRQIRLLAQVDVPVLILGESGTGKEVIARLIHKYSQRSREKFLNVNCAALPSELLESELFGHTRGAFTGAIKDKQGRFEQAHHGTLLLDEVGEMSVQMQAKLLHVLQDGTFTRLGGQETTKVDVRILAATNVEIEGALRQKAFREDLYYRLNTFTIHLPPLRDRREEIPCLIEEIIRRSPGQARSSADCGFCTRLMDAALIYDWRGNIRELRNFVTRTIVMRDPDSAIQELEGKIAAKEKAANQEHPANATIHHPALRSQVRDVKDRAEVRMIKDALELSGWNRRRAAQYLNISYRALLYKIQQHRLAPPLPNPQ